MAFDWTLVENSVPLLGAGLVTTLKISSLAMLLGLVLGSVLGLASMSRSRTLRWCVRAYVDFIRGTPLLIQIFLVYFALPEIGINLPEFWAGVIALALNAAGFLAEIFRGGLNSVEKGQAEAARSIGMRHHQILWHVLLPQSLRAVVPPATNEMISLVKGSALLSVISVYELTRAGQAIIAVHFAPFELFLLIALYYYLTVSALAWLSRWLEKRLPAW
ncbi:amino acid ABC transporter permease [Pseudorhodoferax soli]|jgi:polar amino acid transport system permease protein|uniref:Putative glutamine transport system permease protein GlnP n=1 Tax=Pseudorhodoferax soli TaxID=545864 RepID=A0A368YDU8_9BURK|nr:amino acid ABC transporter permease [Pseudorhodoferax soli]RCW76354.1 amino acid ABC transporter membrane protein (PAAT family) [Pseudorhodoferax soli]